jgi:hypothetical protein
VLGPVSEPHVWELLQVVNVFRLNALHGYWLCDLCLNAVVCSHKTISDSDGYMFSDEADSDSENV